MKRSRQLEKENKFEQFKRQQKLHPEFAGIYADAFLATPQEVHFFRELLVFDKKVCVDSIVGVLQIQPHTTMRELRLLLRDEPTWVSQPVGPPVACPACLVRPTADLACRSAWAGLLGCAHGQERFLEQQELGLVCGQEELALSRGVLVEDIGLSGSNDNEGTVTMPRHGMSGAMVVRTASPALCPIQYPIGCRRAVLTAAPGRLPYDPFGASGSRPPEALADVRGLAHYF